MSVVEMITLVCMVVVTAGGAVYSVQILTRGHWSDRRKWWAALAVCAVFGLASSWLSGDVLQLWSHWGGWTSAEVYAYVASVVVIAKGFYHTIVKPALQKKIQAKA